jgi:simple sugar transport system permease protein
MTSQDERLIRDSLFRRLLRRPELGAVSGTILVWLFFAFAAGGRGFLTVGGTANYLEVAAQLGILAVAVALLMIAGEYDLSVGSVIGAAGMITAVLTMQLKWNIWAAIAAALAVSLLIGLINGVMVVQTKLPSFIITLGSLFIVRGATIALTRLVTGRTQVGGLKNAPDFDSAAAVFANGFRVLDPTTGERAVMVEFPISIGWWLLVVGLATFVLLRTRPGNWIFGIGGDAKAARNIGVPVDRMKILLFMTTAAAAWLVATIQVISVGSADTLRGQQWEFNAIIAAVVGGNLLTGGYGSAVGAMFGALIFGMVKQGIVYTGVDSDWFQVFLGTMLILAVLVNNFIRKRVSEKR